MDFNLATLLSQVNFFKEFIVICLRKKKLIEFQYAFQNPVIK